MSRDVTPASMKHVQYLNEMWLLFMRGEKLHKNLGQEAKKNSHHSL